jgi:hypothetical protein
VRRNPFGCGLLQRLVGEEPIRWVGEFDCRLSPQQGCLHQHRGTLTETVTRRGDVGEQRGVCEPKPVDLVQVPRTRVGPQVGDIVEAERYDGLTPVTMTL